MKKIIAEYKIIFSDKKFAVSISAAALILLLSFTVNFYASQYATRSAGNGIADVVLDNISPHDVDGIFIYGPFILSAFLAILCLIKPQRLPYVLKTVALFILIRSIFITLTHLGPPPGNIVISSPPRIFSDISFGGDLFFSGHAGFPFLLALIFQKNKILKYLFFIASIFFSVVVLLGHLHYSIDVLSAFFITYTIYRISLRIFAKDFSLFEDIKN